MVSGRVQHSILLGVVLFVIYSSRSILNMALLDMIGRKDTLVEDSKSNLNATCHIEELHEPELDISIHINSSLPDSKNSEISGLKFNWDEGQVGTLNAAYYFGYVPSMMPGTVIGARIGYYNYVAAMLFITSLFIVSFPLVTCTFGFYGAVISRILLGVVHGPTTSIICGTWYYWCLVSELTTLSAVYQVGAGLGIVVVSGVGGTILNMGYRWPTIFYCFFVVDIVASIIFFIRASERPDHTEHMLNRFRPLRFSNTISADEVKLLANDRPAQSTAPSVPWSAIVFSMDTWLFVAAWFSATVTLVSFHSYLPRFLQYFLFEDMASITRFVTFQAVTSLPLMLAFSKLADVLRYRFPTPTIRKAMFIIPSIILVIAFVMIMVYPCRRFLIYGALTVIGATNSIVLTASCKPIPNELGGKFASQVYAFTNTVGSLAGIVGPVMVGYLLKMGPIYEIESWYYPGAFAAIIQFIGAIFITIPNLTYLPFTKSGSQFLVELDEKQALNKI